MSAILVCTSGCAMSKSNGKAVMVMGAASALGGGLLMSASGVDSDSDGSNETILNDDLSMGLMGAVLFAAGIGMVIAGITADGPDEAEAVWTPAPIVQPIAPSYAPPPALTVTVTTTVEVTTVEPQLRMFPDVPTTGLVLQLALQARAAAVHGHCDSAWYTVGEIQAQDPAYAAALSAGPALEGCPMPSP